MVKFTGAWEVYRSDEKSLLSFNLEEFGLEEFKFKISDPGRLTSVELQGLVTQTEIESREDLRKIQAIYTEKKVELDIMVESGSMTEEELQIKLSNLTLDEMNLMSALERNINKS